MHDAHGKKKTIWSSDTQRKNNDVNFKVTDDDATVTAWDSHIALTPRSCENWNRRRNFQRNWKSIGSSSVKELHAFEASWERSERLSPDPELVMTDLSILFARFGLNSSCTLALACVHLKQWSKSNRSPINLHWFSISHSKVTILSVKLCRCQANASH